jgi:hypothetical protein
MSALEQFLDPKNGWLTPEIAQRILQWRPDESIRARIQELGDKANEGLLTREESDEYERLINEGDLIAIVQLGARTAHEQAAQ